MTQEKPELGITTIKLQVSITGGLYGVRVDALGLCICKALGFGV